MCLETSGTSKYWGVAPQVYPEYKVESVRGGIPTRQVSFQIAYSQRGNRMQRHFRTRGLVLMDEISFVMETGLH